MGKKFCESKHVSCKYFSFLTYQRSIEILYETLDTLIEALPAFTVSLSFVHRQTNKSRDQAPKQCEKKVEMKTLRLCLDQISGLFYII